MKEGEVSCGCFPFLTDAGKNATFQIQTKGGIRMIFDSHAHYDDEAFAKDREVLLAGMPGAGIGKILNVGASLAGAEASVALSRKYPFVYAAAGIHPDDVGTLDEEKLQRLRDLCREEKTVAIGEIGLDYYWDKEPREIQKKWFREQLALAREQQLPVSIHSRDAAQDTFEILKSDHAGGAGGVLHCFSSSPQLAEEYVKMGYYIGIGGTVTFKNARVPKEVAARVPLERILIETDCPYLAPTPHRGKRNSSLNLPLVIQEIARIKGLTPDDVETATYENACRLFCIDPM